MKYGYVCRDCGVEAEIECPMGEQPESTGCPACKGVARRVFAVAAVVYVGTGWSGSGHGIPDMDEREKLPGPLDFSDKMEDQ